MRLARVTVEEAFRAVLPDLRVEALEHEQLKKAPWAACIGIDVSADVDAADRIRPEVLRQLGGRLPYAQIWGDRLVIGFKVMGVTEADREAVDGFAYRVAERLNCWPGGVVVSDIVYASSKDLFRL